MFCFCHPQIRDELLYLYYRDATLCLCMYWTLFLSASSLNCSLNLKLCEHVAGLPIIPKYCIHSLTFPFLCVTPSLPPHGSTLSSKSLFPLGFPDCPPTSFDTQVHTMHWVPTTCSLELLALMYQVETYQIDNIQLFLTCITAIAYSST